MQVGGRRTIYAWPPGVLLGHIGMLATYSYDVAVRPGPLLLPVESRIGSS